MELPIEDPNAPIDPVGGGADPTGGTDPSPTGFDDQSGGNGLLADADLGTIDAYEWPTTAAEATGYDAALGGDTPTVETEEWQGDIFDANTADASGRNGFVEDRLTGLLSKDSEYMQSARTKALQEQNRMGTANSSMAIGAAHKSAIDAGLPIASQDASAFNQIGLANQASTNRAASENARTINEANTWNATAENQQNLADQQYQNQAEQYNATASNEFAIQNKVALDRSAADFAGAKNTASIQDANNNLKLLLASAEEDLSTYSTDVQRKTALDNIAAELVRSGLNAGIFATQDQGANWIGMIGQLFPDMGLSVTDQLSTEAAAGVV